MTDSLVRPSLTEHLARVLSTVTPRAPVTLPLLDAIDCVLAKDAHATLAVPPFSNSAMDGYLVNSADLDGAGPWSLPVSGDVPAGGTVTVVQPGTAVRIMTGAPVGDPRVPGLVVIPVEDTNTPPGPNTLPESVTIMGFRGRAHIRPRGDNLSVGDRVAASGELIDAGLLAGLISAGVSQVDVFPTPTVTVLSSGDELVQAGVVPEPGQIPDSNRPMVAALVRHTGVAHVVEVHSGDGAAEFSHAFIKAVESSDLVITTGGVSAGAFDVVKDVVGAGGEMWFGGVSIQPGKPQGTGRWIREDGTTSAVLCLPGNPVAAFVSFHLFASPALTKLRGFEVSEHLQTRPRVMARAAVDFPDPRGKDLIVPVRLTWDEAGAVATSFTKEGRGSHFVASLGNVDGFAIIPADGYGAVVGVPLQVYLT